MEGHISHNCAAHETGNTHLLRAQSDRNISAMMMQLNGNTHPLKVKSGRNMSAAIVLPMEYKYAHADNRKWQKHVSRDGAAHEMRLRTH